MWEAWILWTKVRPFSKLGPKEQNGGPKEQNWGPKGPKRRFVSINRDSALPRPLTAGRWWRSHSERQRGQNRKNLSQRNRWFGNLSHRQAKHLTQSEEFVTTTKCFVRAIRGICHMKIKQVKTEFFTSMFWFWFLSRFHPSSDRQLEVETQTESRAEPRYLATAIKYKKLNRIRIINTNGRTQIHVAQNKGICQQLALALSNTNDHG